MVKPTVQCRHSTLTTFAESLILSASCANRPAAKPVLRYVIRALHLLLAGHLLVSTMGVGLFEHLCQMRGHSVSLVGAVDACCSEEAQTCDAHVNVRAAAEDSGPVMTKAPCCQDRASWMQADLDGTVPTQALGAAPIVAALPPVLAKAALPAAPEVTALSLKVVRAMRYRPPCPDVDVRVRVQSFLI